MHMGAKLIRGRCVMVILSVSLMGIRKRDIISGGVYEAVYGRD